MNQKVRHNETNAINFFFVQCMSMDAHLKLTSYSLPIQQKLGIEYSSRFHIIVSKHMQLHLRVRSQLATTTYLFHVVSWTFDVVRNGLLGYQCCCSHINISLSPSSNRPSQFQNITYSIDRQSIRDRSYTLIYTMEDTRSLNKEFGSGNIGSCRKFFLSNSSSIHLLSSSCSLPPHVHLHLGQIWTVTA